MSGRSDGRKKKRKTSKKKKGSAARAEALGEEKEVAATASLDVEGSHGDGEASDQGGAENVAVHVAQADAASDEENVEDDSSPKPTLAEMAEEVVRPSEGAETLLSVASHIPGGLAGAADDDLAVLEQEVRESQEDGDSVSPAKSHEEESKKDSGDVLPADENNKENPLVKSTSDKPSTASAVVSPLVGESSAALEKAEQLESEETSKETEVNAEEPCVKKEAEVIEEKPVEVPSSDEKETESAEAPKTLLSQVEEQVQEEREKQQQQPDDVEKTEDVASTQPVDEHKEEQVRHEAELPSGGADTYTRREPVDSHRPQASASEQGGGSDGEQPGERTPLLSGGQSTSQQSESENSQCCPGCVLL